MNHIFKLNMYFMLNPQKIPVVIKKPNVPISRLIARYIFEHGPTSGGMLSKHFKSTIFTSISHYIKAGLITIEYVHSHKSIYKIAEGKTLADFGLND